MPAPLALSPEQIANLPPDEQQKYMQNLSPAQQQLVQQEIHKKVIVGNRQFMRMSCEKDAACPVTGGSGTSAAYSTGQTLFFDMPYVPGYAKGVLISYNLTVTPASGTSAAYALNAAAPYNVFSELQLLYNGPQGRTHPYFCSIVDQLQGYGKPAQNAVGIGSGDATINGQINSTNPITVGSGNTWTGKIYWRLNALGEDTVPGVLPMNAVGNRPQLKITCNPSLIGQDPLMNVLSPTTGTGHACTITGTVSVDAIFLDGINMDHTQPLSLNWRNESTLQYYWDSALTPFTAGTLMSQTVSTKLKHWYMVSVIIDGTSATKFAQLANITGFQLGPDQVSSQKFYNWNISNNVSIYNFYDRMVRRPFGQDLADGVIPWVTGPSRGVVDADNKNGIASLNMQQGGYPAATHYYQMSTVGTQSTIDGFPACTPRVETFLISENKDGLRVGA